MIDGHQAAAVAACAKRLVQCPLHRRPVKRTLGFHRLSQAQRRAPKRVLREELGHIIDRARPVQFARRWLHEHRLIVPRERELRTMIAKAIGALETQLARTIVGTVDPALLGEWRTILTRPRASGAGLLLGKRLASLLAGTAAECLDLRNVHETPGHPGIAEQSFILTGVVAHVVGTPLADDDTAQGCRAGVFD